MNLLQLTLRVPWPANDGGAQAMYHLAHALRTHGHGLTIAALNTPKHYAPTETLQRLAPAFATDIDTRIRPLAALQNLLFSGLPYNVARFYSPAHEQALTQHLHDNTYDLIQLEGVYLALYIDALRRASRAPVLLRAHNVEYTIWERYAAAEPPGPRRAYFAHLARRGRRFEADQLPRFDGVAALTRQDADHFPRLGYQGPLEVLPPGIDPPSTAAPPPDEPASLCFLASLEWLPNVQGLRWFLDEVWPRIRAARPDVRFHIAGKNPPADLRVPEGAVLHGPVPDALAFLGRYGPVVVPLLSGSGIRMKILEAMAWGKAVVTTSIGAEGIDAPEGDTLARADTPEAFARQALLLLDDADRCARVGQAARHWVSDRFGWPALLPRYVDFYRTLGA